MRRATDLLGDLPDLPAFLAARACQEPPEQRLMAIAGWDVWHIVRAELGDVLDWLEAAERKKRPTPAEVAKDEKAIRDMQRFGKPTKRQQQDAARLRQGKKKGGGK